MVSTAAQWTVIDLYVEWGKKLVIYQSCGQIQNI
jgi:hypothetical protein